MNFTKLISLKPYLLKFLGFILPYLIPFVLGVIITSIFLHRDVVIPKDNPVVKKQIQQDKKDIKKLDQELDNLKKHGISKELDKNPIEYWKTH
jgi:hypothetical protein